MSATPHAADEDVGASGAGAEQLIIVIGGDESRGLKVKELIEFMDAPRVRVATPDNWRARLGGSRLAAVFLADDLDGDEVDRLIADVGAARPEASVVVLNAAAEG